MRVNVIKYNASHGSFWCTSIYGTYRMYKNINAIVESLRGGRIKQWS